MVEGQPILRAERLLSGRSPNKEFRDAILERIDNLEDLSPYRTDTTPHDRMFVGRVDILNKLRRRTENQFITGARRIGKSTLAIHLQRKLGMLSKPSRLTGSNRQPIRKCSYVDVSEMGTKVSEELWGKIIRGFQIDMRSVEKYGRKLTLTADKNTKRSYLFGGDARALDWIISQFRGELTIILDEVDGWIYEEALTGWRMLDQLRALTDENRARVILVGYESLMAALGSVRFPFYLRGETNLLDPLDREAIDDLVTQPMAELNIRLDPESEMLETIWRETSGVPHLVQDICKHLMSFCLTGKPRKTVLTNADLRTAILNSQSHNTFRRGVFNWDFPLAEFIAGITSFVLSRAEDSGADCMTYLQQSDYFRSEEITIGGIRDLLEEAKFAYHHREFDLAINNLKLNLILAPTDSDETRWRWVNQVRREAMVNSIKGLSYKHWQDDKKKDHANGGWRETYRVLGRL